VNAAVLDPRAATAAAIARSQMPYGHLDGTSPHPRAVADVALNRFGLTLSAAEIRTAIEAAMAR
jgi:hypothetical protein